MPTKREPKKEVYNMHPRDRMQARIEQLEARRGLQVESVHTITPLIFPFTEHGLYVQAVLSDGSVHYITDCCARHSKSDDYLEWAHEAVIAAHT